MSLPSELAWPPSFCISEAGLPYVAQLGLELCAVLLQPPECWDCGLERTDPDSEGRSHPGS